MISEQKDKVSAIYGTPFNSRMFVGYTDGKLEARNSSSLSVMDEVNLRSKVMAMVSDEKTLYISLRNG